MAGELILFLAGDAEVDSLQSLEQSTITQLQLNFFSIRIIFPPTTTQMVLLQQNEEIPNISADKIMNCCYVNYGLIF